MLQIKILTNSLFLISHLKVYICLKSLISSDYYGKQVQHELPHVSTPHNLAGNVVDYILYM